MEQTAPAGWYPQPDGSQRYWDVRAWGPPAPPAPQPYAGAVAPAYAPGPGGYGVAPKSPGLALLASFFVPGLGTILNAEGGKGALILVLYGVAVLFSLVLIGLPFALGIWIWGLVDAHSGAQRWNARHGLWA